MPDEKLEDKGESSWEEIELSEIEELRFCKLIQIQHLMTELLATLTIDSKDLIAIDKLGDSVYEQLKQIAAERYKSARKCPALSKRMSRELKRALRGRTIKDVTVKKEPHQVYIKFVTTKGTIGIGATSTGVWVDKEEAFKRDNMHAHGNIRADCMKEMIEKEEEVRMEGKSYTH